MKLIRKIGLLRKTLQPFVRSGKKIGLVPTMGSFHEGHLSLIKQARKECACVVVSLFVNPLQFGPKEDFKRYPRDLTRDIRLARQAGADVLFAPAVQELYGEGYQTTVDLKEISQPLCGRSRPGHFRGVATVVAKLFNLVKPQTAYFGQKDYQQVRLIEQMTKDLSYDICIRVLPTYREKNGLAMSSRNVYLSPEERKKASGIYRTLKETKAKFKRGERNVKRLETFLRKSLQDVLGPPSVEYAEILDAETLKPIRRVAKRAVAAVALRVGKTRLIDNLILGG